MHKHSRKILLRICGKEIVRYWCFQHKRWCTFTEEDLKKFD